jgi:uncharacterized protein YwgA
MNDGNLILCYPLLSRYKSIPFKVMQSQQTLKLDKFHFVYLKSEFTILADYIC